MKSLLRVIAVLVPLAVPGCCLIGSVTDMGCEQWIANKYENASYDDVFEIAYRQIDRDYQIASTSNHAEGRIETEWDTNSMSDVTRLLQRERVVAMVEPEDDGIVLKIRVQRQVREHTGLLTPVDEGDDDWSYVHDDFERAQVMFGRIQALLSKSGPSEEFYQRKPFTFEEPRPGDTP
jgi:hypothetical protein